MIKNNIFTKKNCILLGIAACVFKIFLASTQYITIYGIEAPIDDGLMISLAENIAKGDWFGTYGPLTLSKHSFFAVWLAFVHITGIPFTAANAVLWCACCAFCVWAFSPVIKQNFAKLFVFVLLVYNPAQTAQFTTRIYRDSIFPALCLVFFSAFAAAALRYNHSVKKIIGICAVCGLFAGLIYLTREDGIWIVPFWIAAVVITAIILFVKKDKSKVKKSISLLFVPILVFGAVISSYCYMNYIHYGRFIISDFTQGEFKDAYGAMLSIKQEEKVDSVAVTYDVIQKLYEQVPSFSLLKEYMESEKIVNSYMDKSLNQFKGGSLYWAIRICAGQAGMYDSPQKAKEYFETMYREILTAIEDGRLETDKPVKSSLNPSVDFSYTADTIKEAFNSIKAVFGFEQCEPTALVTVRTDEEINQIQNFVHQKGSKVYKAYTDQMYLPPLQRITHTVMNIIAFIYKIIIPFMFISAFIWQIKQLNANIRQRNFDKNCMLNIIMLGFCLMALFRIFMISYVEVSSFTIGTYVMYLSSVHPLVIAYSAVGFIKNFEN